MKEDNDILEFFSDALAVCIAEGYETEIDIVRARRFENMTSKDFLHEYAFVVLNAGMKNQVAERIYWRFAKNLDTSVINHPGKKRAIELALESYETWFNSLKTIATNEWKVRYLETLPWIGPITKYHLARNLGIDYAKPDRHLKRLAKRFNFKNVQEMCKFISKNNGERIGTVDVILWRYSNLRGSKLLPKVKSLEDYQ